MKSLFAYALPALLALSPAAAGDDRLGADWIQMPEVVVRAYALGFSDISEIEAEDGVWKIKGHQNGVSAKVQLDPHTGEVIVGKMKHNK